MITAFIHKFSSPKSFVNLTEKLYPFFIIAGVSFLIVDLKVQRLLTQWPLSFRSLRKLPDPDSWPDL